MVSSGSSGKIQEQISIEARIFLRDHRYINEPLYKTLDRIIGMYKVSDVAPYVESNRKLSICMQETERRYNEIKKENQRLLKVINDMEQIIDNQRDRTITEFVAQ